MMYQLKSNDFFTNPRKAITTELRAPQENFPEHSHDFQELVIVSKGSGIHVVNDVPSSMTKNHVFFVEPTDRHLFENVDNLYLSNILFRKDILSVPSGLTNYIPDGDSDERSWHISQQAMLRISYLIENLDKEVRNQQNDSEFMALALFQQLVVELNRGKLTPLEMASIDDKSMQALEWIQTHFGDELCIGQVADQFQLTPRTLSRRIKQMTNLSFNGVLHQARINKAIQLLQYSERSITDIAFEVGYSDSNYFSTKFKKITQKSPSDYR